MKTLLDQDFQYVKASDMDPDYLKRKFAAMNDPINEALSNVAHAGLKAGYEMQQVKLERIWQAYERAQKDPGARIPSYLTAAIAAAKA